MWILILIRTLVFIFVFLMLYLQPLPLEKAENLNTLTATLSATLLGFVITALSILTAASSKKAVSALQESGHFKNLTNHLFFCSGFLLLTVISSFIALIFDNCIPTYIIIALFTISLYDFISSGVKFYLVINM